MMRKMKIQEVCVSVTGWLQGHIASAEMHRSGNCDHSWLRGHMASALLEGKQTDVPGPSS